MTRRWTALVVFLAIVCLSSSPEAATPPRPQQSHLDFAKAALPRAGSTLLGVSTDADRLPAFMRAAGMTRVPAILNAWTTPDGSLEPVLENVGRFAGTVPMVSWNLRFTNHRVTGRSMDAYLRSQAVAVRTFGRPVFIRLDWEMNGNWYGDWSLPNVTPAEFQSSWKRVFSIFAQQDARNALFVWCPNVFEYTRPNGAEVPSAMWYPGDKYVDWIGLDAYPQSAPPEVVLKGMNAVTAFSRSRGKPLVLAEWAPNTPLPDSEVPIKLIFDWARRNSDTVRALVYFDFITDGKDYTLRNHPIAAAEFRKQTANRVRFQIGRVRTPPR